MAIRIRNYNDLLEHIYEGTLVFDGADLQGADLEDTDLEQFSFPGANFQGANLQNANLRGVDFTGANLEGVNLQGAILDDTILVNANLRNANLRNAMFGRSFSAPNVAGANFEGVNFEGITGVTGDELRRHANANVPTTTNHSVPSDTPWVQDEDCVGQEDPVTMESIPADRGFKLEAENRCYDALTLAEMKRLNRPLVGPMTRIPFTQKDITRIEDFRRINPNMRVSGGKKRKTRKTRKNRKTKRGKRGNKKRITKRGKKY
jgi:uncharacterized protein YjbI with pentapeptide repeats